MRQRLSPDKFSTTLFLVHMSDEKNVHFFFCFARFVSAIGLSNNTNNNVNVMHYVLCLCRTRHTRAYCTYFDEIITIYMATKYSNFTLFSSLFLTNIVPLFAIECSVVLVALSFRINIAACALVCVRMCV